MEAHRVLRPGGLLLAAGISRFASTLDGPRTGAITDGTFEAIVQDDLLTGVHRNPDVQGRPEWFTLAYFHAPDELREEVRHSGFPDADVFAVEGPAHRRPSKVISTTRPRAQRSCGRSNGSNASRACSGPAHIC
ncbi:hypothetical protein [Amycolatopsis sp. lyj-108]|uniref:hypothetical protein n=1 Tax=Amycolatopsis sp. lyj-108 TaxID=2789286 RepID=UPI003978B95F